MNVEELVKEAHKAAQWDDSPSQILLELADKLEELAAEVERVRDGNRYAHLEQIAIKRANKAEAALAEAKRENEAATVYAETLATALHVKHYAEITNWRPLSGDLFGLLTQIDNMAAGLARHAGGKDAE